VTQTNETTLETRRGRRMLGISIVEVGPDPTNVLVKRG